MRVEEARSSDSVVAGGQMAGPRAMTIWIEIGALRICLFRGEGGGVNNERAGVNSKAK